MHGTNRSNWTVTDITLTGGNMRILLTIITSLLLSVGLNAARAPKWVNTLQPDYLIVSGEGATIDEAQENAMLKVKQRIMESIAQQVQASSQFKVRETELNGKYLTASEYLSTITTETVDYPFLSGVTEAQVEDTYYEKIRNGKQTHYRYHIKYPYNSLDMMRQVDEFVEYNSSINRRLKAFREDDFSSCNSVEEMVNRLSELKGFQSSLASRDRRREECDQIRLNYINLLHNIRVVAENISREGMDVYLYLGEHAIGSQAAPTLRSECLTSVQALREGQYWRVKYSYAGCYTDEPNKVDITHSVYGRKLRLTTYIQ